LQGHNNFCDDKTILGQLVRGFIDAELPPSTLSKKNPEKYSGVFLIACYVASLLRAG
jgi:hypothetical protein